MLLESNIKKAYRRERSESNIILNPDKVTFFVFFLVPFIFFSFSDKILVYLGW